MTKNNPMASRVVKIKIEFSKKDESVLTGQSKILNWVYNHLLETANRLKKEFIKTGDETTSTTLYSKRGLRNLLPELKTEYPFLKTVHSSPLKTAALRLSGSIQDHQKGKKGKRKGEVTGWPVYRSFSKKFFSLLYDEPKKGFKINGREITLSLGVDKDNKRLKVTGILDCGLSVFKNIEVKNLRITRDHNTYYACICVESLLPEKKKIEKIAAIDPNHKNLGHSVSNTGDSIEIENPYFHKKLTKRIDELKGKRDRCVKKSKKIVSEKGEAYYKPSRRYQFFDQKIKKLCLKRREQTKTYLYTVANKLYKEYDLVAVGDYTPHGGGLNKGMRRSMNNESLIGQFKQVLKWVAARSGKHYEEWNEKYTTKTCSACGFIHKESLNPSIREWICPNCETHHLRDENAARNGLKQILKKMFPCSGHRIENDFIRWAWKYTGLGIDSKSLPGIGVGD